MKIIETPFKGLLLIEPEVYSDNRGWFYETYTKNRYFDNGIDVEFVQDNQSFSVMKGVLRGIHCQINPKSQSKLIRCTRGAIIDTVVDLRKGSDTYKKWISFKLSADNKKQLFIPKGFGHAFVTLSENVEVQYKVDEFYSKEHDRSIKFDDPEIGINWGLTNPLLSQKDSTAPYLKDSDIDFSIKVLVTGAKGQLGHDVVKRLNELGIDNIGTDINDFDITDKQQTESFINNYRPDVVIHCAAYTNVDGAEDDRDKCYAINVNGTSNIAKACKKIKAKMVYISTDYVFDGLGSSPHSEKEQTNPINYYGFSKEQGELAVKEIMDKYYIIRTSWVYGKNGNNFIKKMLKLACEKSEISVVNDQIGSPTYTVDLAKLICDMIQTTKYGIYHGVNEGYCSWYDFAKAIFQKSQCNCNVIPIQTSSFSSRASRPLNSKMSREMLDQNGFHRLPCWEDALSRYLEEIMN